ncbi:MAG: hypothetical protein ACYSUX_00420 [Planctomycetota bacterium]|jgi:hypothetical protein
MKKIIVITLMVLTCFAGFVQADYLGSWNINDYITITATTHRFSTGEKYAATGDVNCWIYEDVTEAQIVDETMAVHDSVTGLYIKRVQLTAGAGFEANKHYTVLIDATVDSVSASTTHNFQILASTNAATVVGTTPPTLAQMAERVRVDVDTNSVKLDDVNDATTLILADTGTSGVAIADGYITAAKLGADAITEAKIADNAIAAEHLAANAIGSSEIATGAIDADSIAVSAIGASEVATDAIDADALATDAIAEIWAILLTDLAANPGDDPAALAALNWLYKLSHNKITKTATESQIYDVDGNKISEAEVSDDGTTYERLEYGAVD